MPTDCGVKPIIETDSSSAVEMACANCSASESAGIPRNAALMSSSALSGSRKKSPETATSDSRPSATSTSTATSFPPGTLYSPRIRPAYPCGILCGERRRRSHRARSAHLFGRQGDQVTTPVSRCGAAQSRGRDRTCRPLAIWPSNGPASADRRDDLCGGRIAATSQLPGEPQRR